MAVTRPTVVAYLVILTAFVYFATEVSISYFERKVVTETIIENESQVAFSTFSLCFPPSRALGAFHQFIKSIALHYKTTDGVKHETNLDKEDYWSEVIIRGGLQCYVIGVKPTSIKNLDAKSAVVTTQTTQLLSFFAFSPERQLPRGLIQLRSRRGSFNSVEYERIRTTLLPYPFPSDCRHYGIGSSFDSRAHCVESCVKSNTLGIVRTITFTLDEARQRQNASSQVTAELARKCLNACPKSDCENEIFVLKLSAAGSGPSYFISPKTIFFAFNQLPQTSLQVYIIYLGDLLAAFIGFSFIKVSNGFVKRLMRSNCAGSLSLRRFRRKYRTAIKRHGKCVFLAIAFAGMAFQFYMCIDSYLRYETISETNFENRAWQQFTLFGLCRQLVNAKIGDLIEETPPLSQLVKGITVIDGATGGQIIYDTPSAISRLQNTSRIFLYQSKLCYLIDIKQTYSLTEYKLRRLTVVKMNFTQVAQQTLYTVELAQVGEGTETWWISSVPTTQHLEMEYVRAYRYLLPYPYTRCYDAVSHGFTLESSCSLECHRKYFTSEVIGTEPPVLLNSLNHFRNASYGYTRGMHRKLYSIITERNEKCKLACKFDYCVQDFLFMWSVHSAIADHVAVDGVGKFSTFAIMSPKTTLTELVIYLSGIIGVWLGLNFSNIVSATSSVLNAKWPRFPKRLVLYLAQTTFLLLFYIQFKGLILAYLDYSTVMDIEVKYLAKVTAPVVSFCLNICYSRPCNEMAAQFTESRLWFEELAIRDPRTLEWRHEQGDVDKLIKSFPKYLPRLGAGICYEMTHDDKLIYDATTLRLSGDIDILRVKSVYISSQSRFGLRLASRSFQFDDYYGGDQECAPREWGSAWFDCDFYNYKTNLLTYPYTTNCRNYQVSQSYCFRTCLQSHVGHSTANFTDVDIRRSPEVMALPNLRNIDRSCIDKCKQPDCTLRMIDARRFSVDRNRNPTNNISLYVNHLPVTNRLTETTYSPQMSFSQLVIYVITYLGILLGIDALLIRDSFLFCARIKTSCT